VLKFYENTGSPMQSPWQLDTISRTKLTLEGTTSYFDRVVRYRHLRQQHGSPGQPETSSSDSTRAPRKHLGMAPWHRRGSNDVASWSTTSSIRNLLMGKSPTVTPASESQSQGSKNDQYFQGRCSILLLEIAILILLLTLICS
jgi:hypothetical protein